MINLDTGQETEVSEAEDLEHRLACGPAWCVGQDWQGPWKVTQATVLRVDGSDRVDVPGDALPMRPPIRDRLALLGVPTVDGDDSNPKTWGAATLGHVMQIYDRCTGEAALLGSYDALTKPETPWGAIKAGVWPQDGPVLYWPTTQNRLMVVDLARVGASPCSV
ncbi:hypothetical protein ACFWYW_17315 [Nonomuraea sp. NPDC059023]|uniref:hypothetical protein n=1 Tax=unclassified Nonomuraea TaxID=2593643 RepID=UPI0036C69938